MSDPRVDAAAMELVIGRMAVTQLNTDDFQKVHVCLEALKQLSIARGDVERVKRIHRVKKELSHFEHRVKNAARTEGLPTLSQGTRMRGQALCPSLTELESALENMMTRGVLEHAQLDYIPNIIALTKQKIDDLLKIEGYKQAQGYEDALRKLIIMEEERSTEGRRVTKKNTMDGYMQKALFELANVESIYESDVAEIEEFRVNERMEIKSRHARELHAFDEVTKAGMGKSFIKLSHKLLNYREQEWALVASKRYSEASDKKQVADELEAQEMKNLEAKFASMRVIKRGQICHVHAQELACFDQKAERRIVAVKQRYEAEIDGKRRTVENLERRVTFMDGIIEAEASQSVTKGKVSRAKTRAPSVKGSPLISKRATPKRARSMLTTPMASGRGRGKTPKKLVDTSVQTRARCRYLEAL